MSEFTQVELERALPLLNLLGDDFCLTRGRLNGQNVVMVCEVEPVFSLGDVVEEYLFHPVCIIATEEVLDQMRPLPEGVQYA